MTATAVGLIPPTCPDCSRALKGTPTRRGGVTTFPISEPTNRYAMSRVPTEVVLIVVTTLLFPGAHRAVLAQGFTGAQEWHRTVPTSVARMGPIQLGYPARHAPRIGVKGRLPRAPLAMSSSNPLGAPASG